MVSAISGILKAPFDILADKLRGYIGLTLDLFERPQKIRQACKALMPHLLHVALSGADPDKNVPIGFWMSQEIRDVKQFTLVTGSSLRTKILPEVAPTQV